MDRPGLLYVAATLLPLVASLLLGVMGLIRQAARPRETGGNPRLYQLLGGDRPGRLGGIIATAAIGLACVLSVIGLIEYRSDPTPERWQGRIAWAQIGQFTPTPEERAPDLATHLDLGYRIDALAAYLFVMI